MPKPIPIIEKQKWLLEYQQGKSKFAIAKAHKKDVRTIKKGIEDVLYDQEAREARVGFLRERLSRHQDSLLEELRSIKLSIRIPEIDHAPLSWNQGANSVFSYEHLVLQNPPNNSLNKENVKVMTIRSLMEEHLRKDPMIEYLNAYETAYEKNIEKRRELQKAVLATLQTTTQLKVTDKREATPYICSYTTGDLFYRKLLMNYGSEDDDLCMEIKIDAENGDVTYRGNILVKLLGNGELYRKQLCEAYSKLQNAPELIRVSSTQKILNTAASNLLQAINEILLLGIVNGKCRVCRRLGL